MNPCPPPVPGGVVDRLPSRLWAKYWEKFPNGEGLTSEVFGAVITQHAYCATCGEWSDEKKLVKLDKSKLSSDVIRSLNGSLVCRGCMGPCDGCMNMIIGLQRWRHDKLCAVCLLKKKTLTNKPKEKPRALFKPNK